MAFCSNCGAELDEGVAFCTNCGAKQEVVPPEVQGESSSEAKNDEEKPRFIEESQNAEAKPVQSEETQKTEAESVQAAEKHETEAESVQPAKSQKTDGEKQEKEKPFAKKYKHLKVANIIAWVLFVLSAGAAVTFLVLWMEKDSAYWYISSKYNYESRKNSAVCKAFDVPDSNASIYVAIDKLYNEADGSTYLDHTRITYLNFSYSILYGYVSDSEKLYVKIEQPNGLLMSNPSSSPNGYTLACEAKNSWNGWGNDTPGSAYTTASAL